MSFSINLGNWNSIFAVPSAVVDKHIKLAGSAQLKVLLWVLRNAGVSFETQDIANALNMHPVDVKDAMQYWIETGVLSQNEDKLIPGESKKVNEIETTKENTVSIPINDIKVTTLESQKHPRLLTRPQRPDSAFVSKRIEENKDIAYLMQEAEVIMGRLMSNGDCATLLMLHDNDGLPVEVIIMILHYCASINKLNMRYVEKTAINWADQEVDTLEKAEEKIKELTERKKAWGIVQKTIGIDKRSPTTKEDEAANRWVIKWGYTPDLIREAYERCVDAKGKYLVSYIDKIIERWNKNGIKTIEQARQERLNTKKQKLTEEKAPSYNIDEYEKTNIFDTDILDRM